MKGLLSFEGRTFSAPREAGNLAVCHVSRDRWSQEFELRRRDRGDCLLLYLISGELSLTLGESALPQKLPAGGLSLIVPGTPHQISVQSAQAEVYIVRFQAGNLSLLSEVLSGQSARVLPLQKPQRMLREFEVMHRDAMEIAASNQELCSLRLAVIFGYFRQELAEEAAAGAFRWQEIRHDLEVHFREFPTVRTWASRCGIGPDHLNRLCLQHTGQHALDLLLDLKISHAKELLLSGLPAAECARLTSFSSPSSFSRCFRARTGKSPRAYRAQVTAP